MKQLKSFSFYRDCEQTDSRDIAAGRIERCHGAGFYRVVTRDEDDRDDCSCSLRRWYGLVSADEQHHWGFALAGAVHGFISREARSPRQG